MAFSGTEMPTAAKRMYCPIYVLFSEGCLTQRWPGPSVTGATWVRCMLGS